MEEMLRTFRRELAALPGCATGPGTRYITLSREGYQKSAYVEDELIWLKSACREEAEQHLRERLFEARRKLDCFTGEYEPENLLTNLQTVLQERTAALRDLLRACPVKAAEEIAGLLAPDAVMARMAEINTALNAKYTMKGLGVYLPLIRYEVCDPSDSESGVLWLIAKAFCRYGYDLLDAIHKIEADAQEVLEAYQRAFETQAELQIQTLMVHPIQNKLLLLETRGET